MAPKPPARIQDPPARGIPVPGAKPQPVGTPEGQTDIFTFAKAEDAQTYLKEQVLPTLPEGDQRNLMHGIIGNKAFMEQAVKDGKVKVVSSGGQHKFDMNGFLAAAQASGGEAKGPAEELRKLFGDAKFTEQKPFLPVGAPPAPESTKGKEGWIETGLGALAAVAGLMMGGIEGIIVALIAMVVLFTTGLGKQISEPIAGMLGLGAGVKKETTPGAAFAQGEGLGQTRTEPVSIPIGNTAQPPAPAVTKPEAKQEPWPAGVQEGELLTAAQAKAALMKLPGGSSQQADTVLNGAIGRTVVAGKNPAEEIAYSFVHDGSGHTHLVRGIKTSVARTDRKNVPGFEASSAFSLEDGKWHARKGGAPLAPAVTLDENGRINAGAGLGLIMDGIAAANKPGLVATTPVGVSPEPAAPAPTASGGQSPLTAPRDIPFASEVKTNAVGIDRAPVYTVLAADSAQKWLNHIYSETADSANKGRAAALMKQNTDLPPRPDAVPAYVFAREGGEFFLVKGYSYREGNKQAFQTSAVLPIVGERAHAWHVSKTRDEKSSDRERPFQKIFPGELDGQFFNPNVIRGTERDHLNRRIGDTLTDPAAIVPAKKPATVKQTAADTLSPEQKKLQKAAEIFNQSKNEPLARVDKTGLPVEAMVPEVALPRGEGRAPTV